ncbi:MAG: hypothetical protein WCR71_02025 [Bacteroidales bacterium]
MKKFFIWFAAALITLSAVIYQRVTGPTNPLKVTFSLGGENYKASFPRSLETLVSLNEINSSEVTSELKVKLEPAKSDISLLVMYKRYPREDSLKTIKALYKEGAYYLEMPSQPPAGKIIYYPLLIKDCKEIMLQKESGIILRFKAPVSSRILIPHIILMFAAMLFSNFAGIAAFFNISKIGKYAIITLIALGVGGLVFGPLVQKAAFGAYWTGWPFGQDLTDTKTLFAFLIWLTAWFLNKKKKRKFLYTIAAAVTLLVYTIPHSTAGSQFDYEKGVVITGAAKE